MKKQANHSSFIYQFFIFRVPSSAPHNTKQNPGTFDQYFSAHSVAIFQEQTGSDMYISRFRKNASQKLLTTNEGGGGNQVCLSVCPSVRH